MANWYYAVAGQTEGPVDVDTLRSLARQGVLTPSTYVIPEGEQTWQALSDVEVTVGLSRNTLGTYADLAPPAPLAVTPPAPLPAPAAPQTPPPTEWTQPGYPQPGNPQPGPGYPQPGYPQPGYQQPGYPQPGYPQPGYQQPWSEQSWTNPAPAGWSVAGTTGPNGEPMASWGARLGAKLIDAILLFVPFLVVLMTVAGQEIQDRIDEDGGFTFSSGRLTTTISIASYVVGWLYYAVLNGSGQTLGKKLLGIKVVDATTGAPIGLGRGMLRHLLQLFSWLVFCIGWVFVLVDALSPLWDGRKQALHDKLARSVVVKTR